jgi:predicted nuclease of predicted toxin-antitoxin system
LPSSKRRLKNCSPLPELKLLLDECLDWRLRRDLPGHEVMSVQEMGWSGIKNGRLLALAQSEFQVLITGDRNLSFQNDLPRFRIAVVVLKAGSTRLSDTRPLMPKVATLLPLLKPG